MLPDPNFALTAGCDKSELVPDAVFIAKELAQARTK